jgi:hypothetical protein
MIQASVDGTFVPYAKTVGRRVSPVPLLTLDGCRCAQQDCASIDLDTGDGAWLSKQTCSGAHAGMLVLEWQAWPRAGTPSWRLKQWQRRVFAIARPNEIARTRFLGKQLVHLPRSRGSLDPPGADDRAAPAPRGVLEPRPPRGCGHSVSA